MLRIVPATLLWLGVLCGCGNQPSGAQVEAVARQAAQRNDPMAEQHLVNWAALGQHVAERELGLLYLTRPPQQAAGRELLARAARAGDAEAAYRMGELERAAGASPRAANWFRQAAQVGHARAALMLGLALLRGDGVQVDKPAALHWLGLAAQAGNPHALFLLSQAYARGDGVARDANRARQLLEQAAARNDAPAQQALQAIAADPSAPPRASAADDARPTNTSVLP